MNIEMYFHNLCKILGPSEKISILGFISLAYSLNYTPPASPFGNVTKKNILDSFILFVPVIIFLVIFSKEKASNFIVFVLFSLT